MMPNKKKTGLDTSAQVVLDLMALGNRPPYESLRPADARQVLLNSRATLQAPPPQVRSVSDIQIDGPGGSLPLRVYRGLGDPRPAVPALVFFHGGGWVIGDIDTHDSLCRALANAGACCVISVGYRLAPENRFPAAVDDAIFAFRWVAGHWERFGIDPKRLGVAGDSAGANLAAVVAIDARDRGEPRVALQVLIYPATDMTMAGQSHALMTADLPLTNRTMLWFREHYLSTEAERDDWRASPLKVPSCKGLPPAYLATAGFDPLRDEGEAYGDRLEAEGVRVIRRSYPGQIHGFATMSKLIPAAQDLLNEIGMIVRSMAPSA